MKLVDNDNKGINSIVLLMMIMYYILRCADYIDSKSISLILLYF